MKIIVLNIKQEEDLYEKYSNNVSRDLINYLIRETKYVNDDIKIRINTKLKIDNIENIIKNGLMKIYNESRKFDKILDSKQIMFFIIGVMFLLLSSLIPTALIKEIIIIAGWVAIWEVVDISLNVDSELKLNRKLVKKLMNSNIEINKEKDFE